MNIAAAAHTITYNAPQVDAFPEWINVKDALPEGRSTMVLCLTSDGLIRIGYLKRRQWQQGCYPASFACAGQTVTHWMPLPPLPSSLILQTE